MRPADAARLLLLAAIWGASYLFIKVALDGFTPLQIVAGRLVTGAIVLIALLYAREMRLPADARTWKLLAFMAVVANIVPFLLITWGEEHITSALAAILNSTTPLFTALFAAMFLTTERLTLVRGSGVLLGFAGVAVVVGVDESAGALIAELAVVLAAVFYGVGFVFSKKKLSAVGLSPLALPAGQLVVGSLVMVPLAGIESAAEPPTFGLIPTVSVLLLGALGTGIAFYIYYRLIQDLGATTASFVTYLIPIFGVAFGWVLLDERLGWNALVGAVLVIAGIALAERGARSHKARAPRPPTEAELHRAAQARP